MVVDAGDGRVLDAFNEREARRPASTTKILTALATVAALPPDSAVPISARAEAMPARKLNMKAGQVWDLEDTLHSLLLSSANDAAVALAERVAGSAEAFGTTLDGLAARLRLADNPVLVDPSGLDDEFSIGGGNYISARDLAIAARAVLAEPRLAPVVATPVYSFTGGDAIAHRIGNHNKLLARYPGAVGMKTGYTKRSGHCLIAAATRDGRTLIAVVLDAVDTYGSVTAMLDRGFASRRGTGDTLPPVPAARLALDPARRAIVGGDGDGAGLDQSSLVAAGSPAAATSGWPVPVIVVAVLLVAIAALRARVRVRRWLRRQRLKNARVRQPKHRPPDPKLTTEFRPRNDIADRFRDVIVADGERRRQAEGGPRGQNDSDEIS